MTRASHIATDIAETTLKMRKFRPTLVWVKIALLTSALWVIIDLWALYHFTGCTDENCLHQELPKNFLPDRQRLLDLSRNAAIVQGDPGVVDQGVVVEGIENENKIVAEDKLLNVVDIDSGDVTIPAKETTSVSLSTIAPSLDNPGDWAREVELTEEEKKMNDDRFKENYFSVVISDKISLHRKLQDYRPTACRHREFPDDLSDTSVVIIFHNEANSTLLRTVHSVIDRSPRKLLKEVILVDDASTQAHLKEPLDKYVSALETPVRVIHLANRTGLIRARLAGAAVATGGVLVFLDSHCECTKGWLEPMLAEIRKDRSTSVVPIINNIDAKTFKYVGSSDATSYMIGGFNWAMVFNWYDVPKRVMDSVGWDLTVPTPTPTMAGGLFAIDREYFEEIGSYDNEMDIWGAENVELSLRIWQCGGSLVTAPCSHVGHVFRTAAPYTSPKRKGSSDLPSQFNARRMVEVWLDDYKDFYYQANPAERGKSAGDVSQRLAIRERLQCKSFRWFMENIWPESPMLTPLTHLGEIKNVQTKWCLDKMTWTSNVKAQAIPCHHSGTNQLWGYSATREIRNDNNCLDTSKDGVPYTYGCHGMRNNQEWIYDLQTRQIVQISSRKCLHASTKPNENLIMSTCDENDMRQQWQMQPFDTSWMQVKH